MNNNSTHLCVLGFSILPKVSASVAWGIVSLQYRVGRRRLMGIVSGCDERRRLMHLVFHNREGHGCGGRWEDGVASISNAATVNRLG